MNITWLGNSSFLLKNSLGKRILIDPITKLNSLNLNSYNPNLITCSEFSDKINYNLENKNIKFINSSGIFKTEFGEIIGINSFADKFNGEKRGRNTIYLFNIDNLKICHLGFLGCNLSIEKLELLKNLDILFIPIGGNINLNPKEAFNLCKKLSPKIIIPMNYKINKNCFLFKEVKEFLLLMKNSQKINTKSFSITSNEINNLKEKVILIPLNK